ncbi:hypothetical protein C8R48DRAFT_675730 [Suillus tomentosus]|nr:hypothetical protein C8R48DRAFT_675730 [Suillus tomentosus]
MSKPASQATDMVLNLASYSSMQGTGFFVSDHYDKLVKKSVAARIITDKGTQAFIENLFPEQCMPKGSNNIPWKNTENHLRDEGIFSPDELAWRDCPNLNAFTHHLEGQFGGFINTVAEICGEALGSSAPRRRWTAKYSTNVLGGHQANRKPDLTLIDQNTSADWRCVRSFGEMKSKKNTAASLNELCDQISVKSAILFGSQDNRNFVIALGFAKYNMIVYRYNRGGLMCSAAISITHPMGWTCFARVAYCLAYCHPHWLGYDISAQLAPCRGPRLMAMQCIPEDKTNLLPESCRLNYAMDAQIHLTDSLFSRGSNIRRVHHVESKESFIVKDTWHNVHRKMTEGQILRVIVGIANIPELVEEYVVSPPHFSCTSTARTLALTASEARSHELEHRFHARVHVRLLMKARSVERVFEDNDSS